MGVAGILKALSREALEAVKVIILTGLVQRGVEVAQVFRGG